MSRFCIDRLAAQLSDLAATVASFADHFTTRELTFVRATGDEIDVKRLKAHETICLGAICITESQLAAMLASANQSAVSTSSSTNGTTTSSSSTPPAITIAGNNPAHIHIGDTYQDLGATAKDSDGHELGVHTFLNGALVSNIVLDTSTTTTDTIDYVATDTNGLTSTSTRTVLIEPSAELPPLSPATSTATIQ